MQSDLCMNSMRGNKRKNNNSRNYNSYISGSSTVTIPTSNQVQGDEVTEQPPDQQYRREMKIKAWSSNSRTNMHSLWDPIGILRRDPSGPPGGFGREAVTFWVVWLPQRELLMTQLLFVEACHSHNTCSGESTVESVLGHLDYGQAPRERSFFLSLCLYTRRKQSDQPFVIEEV